MTAATQISDFLDDWTPRFTTALARAVRAEKDEIDGGRVYVAAITVADGNTAVGLNICTDEYLAKLTSDIDEADEDETREYYRWWPDEWDWAVDGDGGIADPGSLLATSRELDDWARDSEATGERVDGAASWSRDWLAASTDALCRALGSDEVRAAFAEFGSAPVLYVTDTDGRATEALATFERLNAGRDDDDVRDARVFWQNEAKS